MKDRKVPVLVTTEHRGVFFGFATKEDLEKKSFWLERARNCIYWHSKLNGFLGLAAEGPNSDCRIGAEAKELLVHSITSVSICTDKAAAAWTSFK